MKATTVRVWSTNDGRTELLVEKQPGQYRVPGYEMSAGLLAELGEAIADALSEPAGRLAGKITPLPDTR